MQLPTNFDSTWRELHEKLQPKAGKHANKIGLAGEFAFGQFCGLYPNMDKSKSDNGTDFELPLTLKTDVKTSLKYPPFLLLKTNAKVPDILVQVWYNNGNPKILGWEWGSVIVTKPIKDFGCGVPSYYVSCDELKPMQQMEKRLFLRRFYNG